jgi:hypothetical protein
MIAEACYRGMIGRRAAPDLLVRDVMDPEPKTTPATTTVGELRAWFGADARVRTALLLDGVTFVGVVGPDDIPPDAPSDLPVTEFARPPANLIGPERTAAEVLARLDADDQCRAVVLGEDDQSLLGLVCMNATRTHFCVPT